MKKRHAQELSRNQSILRFDVILQHDWPIEQCLHHIRVSFGRKMKRPCFDLFTYWLMKQITNTVTKPFFKVIRKSLYQDFRETCSFSILKCRMFINSSLRFGFVSCRQSFKTTYISLYFTNLNNGRFLP